MLAAALQFRCRKHLALPIGDFSMHQSITRRYFIASLATIVSLGLGSRVVADNWPSWRGPNRDGKCATKLPKRI